MARFISLILIGLLFFNSIKQAIAQPHKRVENFEKHQSDIFSRVPYQSIGPTIMSGRVTDVEVNPSSPEEMLVAYASGGLWYTNNYGQSFKPIFDDQASITIGDIAVDWKTMAIWVGTGENNSSRSSYAGTGIYKSNDTGLTWKHLGLEETHHIGRILLNPVNPEVVYVAALGHLYSANEERGIYKSVNGGLNWQKVLFVNNETGFIDLAFDPNNPEMVIAASWERMRSPWHFKGSGPGSAIYLSNDGGLNWDKIYSGTKIGRIGLAAFSKDGKSGVYAIFDDQNPLPETKKDTSVLTVSDLKAIENEPVESFLRIPDIKLKAFLRANQFPKDLDAKSLKKMIKSKKHTVRDIINYTGDANSNLFSVNYKGTVIIKTNSLENIQWETVNDSIKDLYYTYGYYFGQIRVSPANPDEIYILGVVLARSTNGGKTFSKLIDDNVHGDHHALWINPKKPSHLVNGNDGGLNISYDAGLNWVKCNNAPLGQFYSVAVDEQEPYNVYGGLQDNGVWKGPRNYEQGKGWQQSGKYPYEMILGGDGMQVAVDKKGEIVYTGFQFGNQYRIAKKVNDFMRITPQHTLGEMPYRFNWQSPIILSNHAEGTLYFGGNYLFRSKKFGFNFKKISPDLTKGTKEGNVPFGTLTAIHESPLKKGLLYSGSDDGLIYISKNDGKNWENISIPKYEGHWVSRIQASKFVESRVYATLNGYRSDHFAAMVFVSEDYGKTWRPIKSNLPDEPVNVIREDQVKPYILYLGTDNGLYVTLNGGNRWEKLSGLPRVAVHDLAIQAKANELVVATHGRSLFVVPLNEINQTDTNALKQELFVFDIPKQKVSKNWGSSNYYWSLPSEKEISIPYYVKKGQTVEITLFDSTGIPVLENQGLAKSGLNYLKYNFTANQNQTTSKQLHNGANNQYYLVEGRYKIRFKTSDAMVEKVLVLIKE